MRRLIHIRLSCLPTSSEFAKSVLLNRLLRSGCSGFRRRHCDHREPHRSKPANLELEVTGNDDFTFKREGNGGG